MTTDLTPPTPTVTETSAKTDYIWEVLNNYEHLYDKAIRLAKHCVRFHFTPRRSGQVFQAGFSDLPKSSEYREYTRGTPGKLDWVWIASSFIEELTTPTPTATVDPSTD